MILGSRPAPGRRSRERRLAEYGRSHVRAIVSILAPATLAASSSVSTSATLAASVSVSASATLAASSSVSVPATLDDSSPRRRPGPKSSHVRCTRYLGPGLRRDDDEGERGDLPSTVVPARARSSRTLQRQPSPLRPRSVHRRSSPLRPRPRYRRSSPLRPRPRYRRPSTIRHPGAGRGPSSRPSDARGTWVPACAGTTKQIAHEQRTSYLRPGLRRDDAGRGRHLAPSFPRSRERRIDRSRELTICADYAAADAGVGVVGSSTARNAACTIAAASTSKCARNAARESLRPKPSVPSVT